MSAMWRSANKYSTFRWEMADAIWLWRPVPVQITWPVERKLRVQRLEGPVSGGRQRMERRAGPERRITRKRYVRSR